MAFTRKAMELIIEWPLNNVSYGHTKGTEPCRFALERSKWQYNSM